MNTNLVKSSLNEKAILDPDNDPKIKRKILEKYYGWINYSYSISKKYPNGLLLFMGSFVDPQYRGKGLFVKMMEELLSMFPKGTEVQVPLSNPILINHFKNLGFTEVNGPIEYWGETENSVNMKAVL